MAEPTYRLSPRFADGGDESQPPNGVEDQQRARLRGAVGDIVADLDALNQAGGIGALSPDRERAGRVATTVGRPARIAAGGGEEDDDDEGRYAAAVSELTASVRADDILDPVPMSPYERHAIDLLGGPEGLRDRRFPGEDDAGLVVLSSRHILIGIVVIGVAILLAAATVLLRR